MAIPAMANAGNPERQGQAGAAQLTINGWARSSGWGWANGGGVTGVEASYMNVAGMDKGAMTEIQFSRSLWLVGSGINVNNFGITQKLGADGEGGTLGISLMQFGIKPIEITTEDLPYGGIGTYRVSMSNLGLGYSKSFANNISAGIMARIVSEGIPDARAMGISLDAGVQYSTTLRPLKRKLKGDDVKFGISVKNIGPDMRHQGDGLTYKAVVTNGDFSKSWQAKVERIKLPSLLNIAGSYDIRLDGNKETYDSRLTIAASFTNHAFSANQVSLGAEFAYKGVAAVRAGYVYQEGALSLESRTSAYSGFCAGFSVDLGIGGANTMSLDYSYRHSNPFSGTHSLGLKIGLNYGDAVTAVGKKK